MLKSFTFLDKSLRTKTIHPSSIAKPPPCDGGLTPPSADKPCPQAALLKTLGGNHCWLAVSIGGCILRLVLGLIHHRLILRLILRLRCLLVNHRRLILMAGLRHVAEGIEQHRSTHHVSRAIVNTVVMPAATASPTIRYAETMVVAMPVMTTSLCCIGRLR